MRILCVEDNKDSLELLKVFLEGSGYDVSTATNGVEALDAARKSRPDIIVSDIMMPEMDGFVFCRKIKGETSLKDIPFIFYTATYLDPKDKELGLSLGASRYLEKPMELSKFQKAIDDVMKEARSSQLTELNVPKKSEHEIDDVYQQALVRKLEKKVVELEEERKVSKQNQQMLRHNEERFRGFAEASADWLWETDEDHRFTFISEGVVQATSGLRVEGIVGIKRTDFVKEDMQRDPEKWKKHLTDLDAHRPIRNFQYSIMTPKEGMREFTINGKPIFDDDGTFRGYRGVASDITERKRAEAQIIQSSKLASLGEMATGVAHELNQPINIISMAAEAALEMVNDGDMSTEALAGKLDRILSQTERASAIIGHMRMFGRTDSGELEGVDLKEAVLGAVSLVGEQLRLSGVELSVNLPEACRKIVGRQLQLEQVILNLLTNARDAINFKRNGSSTEQGDDRIVIQVDDDPSADMVRLVVSDTGGGMPEDILDHIFDPFFTTKEIGEGTGIGLSISYGIISGMNGTITAANAGEGAEFVITLPAAVLTTEKA